MDASRAADTFGRCLVCDISQTADSDFAALAEPVGADCSVDACLSAVLRPPLLSLVNRAAGVCRRCFLLLQNIFSLDLQGRTLRRSVRANFAETCRREGAEKGSSDSAAEVARKLQEAEAEDRLGSLSAGVVTGWCRRCGGVEATAAAAAASVQFTKKDVERQNCTKESVLQLQGVHTRHLAKRSQLVQTDGSDPAIVGQIERSYVVSEAPLDVTDDAPVRAEAPCPAVDGASPRPDDGSDESGVSGGPVRGPGSAERPVAERALRRRRRRRLPLPADPAVEGHHCEACGAECLDAAELARHRAVCAPAVLWSCALCDRTFRHLPQLKRHARRHQLSTRQLAVCLKCGQVYPGEAALAEHTASHAPDATDICICGFCGLGFRTQTELAAHSVTHVATCSICHKQLRKDSMREHMRRHTGETPFGCDECGKRFVAYSSLRAHRRTHTGDKPHKCHLCSEMFHLKQSLAEHLERHENKRLHCELCGREFPSSRRLAAHVKTHDKRRWQPHTCEFCGEGFMTKRSLRAHRVRHTGPLPFTCDVCGKGFTYEDTYKEHLSVHSGQRPYTCEVCGKSYGRRSCLWAHRNQHTDPARFRCSHCGKQFTSQSAHNIHLRIHTGERPHRCSTCSASFRLLSALKRHTETCPSGPCLPRPDVAPVAPAAPVPAPAAPVSAAGAVSVAAISVQLCSAGGGTAQIELPAVPQPHGALWPAPEPL